MKKISILTALAIAVALAVSIPRTVNAKLTKSQTFNQAAIVIPYYINLESKAFVNGAWEWVWSIQNTTISRNDQELSHMGLVMGSCFDINDVVTAAYSFNGTSWISFTPKYAVDPSQSCINVPSLKFDAGTIGTKKTYYKLVLSKNYPTSFGTAYYKSGSQIGCGILPPFPGIGNECGVDFWTDN